MRLIDADAYRAIYDQKCARDCGICGFYDSECMCHLIDEAPTIDVVPVVRCKDCEYRDTIECAFACGMLEATDDSFCSYGKAKMGGEA